MKKSLLFFLAVFVSFIAMAQSVVRGPYMQSNTHQSIIVMWRTGTATDTKVWYGTDPANLDRVAYLNNSVTDHAITLTGLQPHTRYYYAVGTNTTVLAGGTQEFTFRTHPVPGTPTPTRIWATGDFGRGNQGQVDAKQAFFNYTGDRGADVWLWLGDNAYNDGTDAEYQSKVFNVPGFSDAFYNTPFYPSPGNHDYNSMWPGGLFIPYTTGLALSRHAGTYYNIVEVPKNGEAGGIPSGYEVFYSFDYGDVHFLSLNSELYAALSSTEMNQMKAWIISDLQQNTRKFTIAYFHQCPHSKGSHDSDDIYELAMRAMRQDIMPTLEAHDVDLIISGHSHIFERSYLIKGFYGTTSTWNPSSMLMSGTSGNYASGTPYVKDGSNATAEGAVYIVCGNSGSSEGSPELNHPIMYYSHGGSAAYGSFVVDVNRNRLDGKYLKSDGQVSDEFTILKRDVILGAIADRTICSGDSVLVTVSFTGGSDRMGYSWGQPGVAGTASVYLAPVSTTTYTLTVTDSLTGQVETTSFVIHVNPAPTAQISETMPGVLYAGVSGLSYQWYINGVEIPGATSEYYQPFMNDNYTVKVTAANGCSTTSAVFNYESAVGLEELRLNEIELYPNPVETVLTLAIPGGKSGAKYQIVDINGRFVAEGKISSSKTTINVTNYVPGTYFISFDIGGTLKRISFVKK